MTSPHRIPFERIAAALLIMAAITPFSFARVSAQQPPTVDTYAPSGVSQNSATANAVINPRGAQTTAWFEFGTTSSLGLTTTAQPVGTGSSSLSFSSFMAGLQPNTTYYYRAVAQNAFGSAQGSVLSFVTLPASGSAQPIATTQAASGASQTSATLNGQAGPNGAETVVWFEFGTSQLLGQRTPQISVGSGNALVSVSTFLSGLQPTTTYYYRIVARNAFATTEGVIVSFNTLPGSSNSLPTAVTSSASGITRTDAQMNGYVNPLGTNATAWFEYGTTQSLGARTANLFVSGVSTPIPVAVALSGLQPNTAYYYRVSAQNNLGTSQGSIVSFTTPASGGSASGGGGAGSGLRPLAFTFGVEGAGETTATLRGSINPNGLNTNGWFEYGRTANLGSILGFNNAGSPAAEVPFTIVVRGFRPGTTYYYRMAGENVAGKGEGSILSFRTLGSAPAPAQPAAEEEPRVSASAPSATTIGASGIQAGSALVSGSVNPKGGKTDVWFEFGPTPSLGFSTDKKTASGTIDISVSEDLSGLAAGTSYYYRVAAENAKGVARGAVVSFRTGIAAVVPQGDGIGSQNVTVRVAANVVQNDSGDEMTYTIIYKNGLALPVTNLVVKASLSPDVTYMGSIPTAASQEGSTFSFPIAEAAPSAEGVIVVRAKTRETSRVSGSIPFQVAMEYLDPAKNPQIAKANLNAQPPRREFLAAARSSFGHFPSVAWFAVAILIALAGWYAFRILRGRNTGKLDDEYPSVSSIKT